MRIANGHNGCDGDPLALAAGELCTQLGRLQALGEVEAEPQELRAILASLQGAWHALETLGRVEGIRAEARDAGGRRRAARPQDRTPAPSVPAALAAEARLRGLGT